MCSATETVRTKYRRVKNSGFGFRKSNVNFYFLIFFLASEILAQNPSFFSKTRPQSDFSCFFFSCFFFLRIFDHVWTADFRKQVFWSFFLKKLRSRRSCEIRFRKPSEPRVLTSAVSIMVCVCAVFALCNIACVLLFFHCVHSNVLLARA